MDIPDKERRFIFKYPFMINVSGMVTNIFQSVCWDTQTARDDIANILYKDYPGLKDVNGYLVESSKFILDRTETYDYGSGKLTIVEND